MRVFVRSAVLLCALFFSQFAQAQENQTFRGSVTQGSPTPETIPLSIPDAIDRALKFNLSSLISQQETRQATADRLRALSELLPKINVTVTNTVEQIDLAAFGFTSFPGINTIVGPFNVFDARAHYSQPAFDLRLKHDLRSQTENLTAANLAQQDVRELVVLVATDLYLEAVASASRVEAVQSQVKTAQAVYDRAVDLKDSGVIPGVDLLRAQVQLHEQQQRLLAAQNDLAKQKLSLARAIGLPQGQSFTQTDTFITTMAAIPPVDQALASALDSRPDYRRSAALVRAADETLKSANARKLPTVGFYADYGDIGARPAESHGTMTVQGTLLVPIYTGGHTQAEILDARAKLDERKAEEGDLRGRIEYELRTADLDIRTAADQVQVAGQARDLAQQQLSQAQDRFSAGVTNGLEVTQAQEAVATADENYITSLFNLNVAEASLARAMGTAEKSIKSFFGGK